MRGRGTSNIANHDDLVVFFCTNLCNPLPWTVRHDMVQSPTTKASPWHPFGLILALTKTFWAWPSPVSFLPKTAFAFAFVTKFAFAFAFSLRWALRRPMPLLTTFETLTIVDCIYLSFQTFYLFLLWFEPFTPITLLAPAPLGIPVWLCWICWLCWLCWLCSGLTNGNSLHRSRS